MRRHDIVCRYTCPTPRTRIDHRPKLLVSRQRPPSSISEFDHIGGGDWQISGLGTRVSDHLPMRPPCLLKPITTTNTHSTQSIIDAEVRPKATTEVGRWGGGTYRATPSRTSSSSDDTRPANRRRRRNSRIHSQLVCGNWKVHGTDLGVWGWGS